MEQVFFFLSFYGPSVKDGKKTRGSITCRKTEQTRLIRCLLYGFVDYFREKNEIIRRFDK